MRLIRIDRLIDTKGDNIASLRLSTMRVMNQVKSKDNAITSLSLRKRREFKITEIAIVEKYVNQTCRGRVFAMTSRRIKSEG